MAEQKPPQSPDPKPSSGSDKPRDGKNAQLDEAKDEGAGKKSVPIGDVTTANDK